MNTQRGILNFFKKVGTNERYDESECEDCDTDVESHHTQANIIDEKIVGPYHPLENYKFSVHSENQRDRVSPLYSKHI